MCRSRSTMSVVGMGPGWAIWESLGGVETVENLETVGKPSPLGGLSNCFKVDGPPPLPSHCQREVSTQGCQGARASLGCWGQRWCRGCSGCRRRGTAPCTAPDGGEGLGCKSLSRKSSIQYRICALVLALALHLAGEGPQLHPTNTTSPLQNFEKNQISFFVVKVGVWPVWPVWPGESNGPPAQQICPKSDCNAREPFGKLTSESRAPLPCLKTRPRASSHPPSPTVLPC